MLFNSIRYIIFLICVVALYWRLPARARKLFLLVASYLFYMNWVPKYGILLLALTLLNYWLGLLLSRAGNHRRAWLWLAIGANLGVLAYYKYTNFLLGNVNAIAGLAGRNFNLHADIILPLGISFFTFEFLHYVVDVYRGQAPVRSWVEFALFSSFFPTRSAGPIRRYQTFVSQLSGVKVFDSAKFNNGLYLILRGLFKKVVLADNAAVAAQAGFSSPAGLGAADAWIAVLGYTLQIYFDFSGYTDIGRGSAALLGFDIPENFNLPYAAKSITEFWRRWHITLSIWLRDYLFLPISYSLSRRWDGVRWLGLADEMWIYGGATMATMLLAGLWHGASWMFVLWGVYHGLGLTVHRGWMRGTKRWKRALRSRPWQIGAWILTQCFICVGWVFFRASSLGTAWKLIRSMTLIGAPRMVGDLNPDNWVTVASILLAYVLYLAAERWAGRENSPSWVQHNARLGRAAVMAGMILGILAFPGEQASFIYFQF